MSAHQDLVTVDILGPAHGGSSVARVDGQVMFVRGALPGEKGVPVSLDASQRGRRFLTGTVADASAIAEPSPHRTAAVCPAAQAGAGCCDLDFIDDIGALALKTTVVREQFARIGGIDLADPADPAAACTVTATSLHPFSGYRTRVRLGVDERGHPGLRRASSNGIIALRGEAGRCAQWAPGLADGLADELAEFELTPGAEVCVAVGDDGERGIVEVPPAPRHRRGRTGSRRRTKSGKARVGRRVLAGSGQVARTVGDVTWSIPAESFWQAHQAAASAYSDWVVSAAPQRRTSSPAGSSTGAAPVAWDLYGGAGVFSAALTGAAPGMRVECVDIASAATSAGRRALADRDIRFVDGDVAATLGSLRGADSATGPSPAVVVLDPPRTGAGESVVEEVAAHRPDTVLQIGCDPATAARDAAAFVRHGYRPDSVTVVDAFGLTHHVEVLVRYVPDTHTTKNDVR